LSFLEWLPNLPEDGAWFASKATGMLSLLLQEADAQKTGNRFKRLMPVRALTDQSHLAPG